MCDGDPQMLLQQGLKYTGELVALRGSHKGFLHGGFNQVQAPLLGSTAYEDLPRDKEADEGLGGSRAWGGGPGVECVP